MLSLQDSGITTHSPLVRMSPSIESLSQKLQQNLAALGTQPCLLGQPFRVSLCTIERMGSHCVSAPILVRHLGVKANIDMALTQRSNLISVFILDGRWLRASARSISLPGWYVMTRSYCCRWRSILWRHAWVPL